MKSVMCTVHHGFHEGLDLRKAEVVRAIQEMGAAGEGLAGAESERLFHAFEVLQADFRKHRPADASPDQLHDRVDVVDLKPGLTADLVLVHPAADADIEADVRGAVDKRQRIERRLVHFVPRHEAHRLFAQYDVALGPWKLAADDREVDFAGEQRLIEVRASLRTQADVHLRVLVNEGFQYVCELEAGIIGGHTDLQRAGEFSLRIRREAADLRQILLDRPHVGEDRLGDRGQDHALFRADEQLTAKLLLDGLDPLRERRLCREQALGGFRDVVGFR